MAKSTVQWLEDAGVDTAAISDKLDAISERFAEKHLTDEKGTVVKVIPAEAPPREVLLSVLMPIIPADAAKAAVANELVDEFLADHAKRDPVVVDAPKSAVAEAVGKAVAEVLERSA